NLLSFGDYQEACLQRFSHAIPCTHRQIQAALPNGALNGFGGHAQSGWLVNRQLTRATTRGGRWVNGQSELLSHIPRWHIQSSLAGAVGRARGGFPRHPFS